MKKAVFHRVLALLLAGASLPALPSARAQTPLIQLDEVVVRGRADDLLGLAASASEGSVGAAELQSRPFLRRGELLEVIPGMVVTQHSGDGKANQYFLRGYNLDHGSDFSISVDGLPVNLRTHAHGQGYCDLNFLIPELLERVDYKKGPFHPEVGDFSGAGAAEFHLFDTLPHGFVTTGLGEHGYARFLAADSPRLGPGNLLYAFEFNHYDGPWTHAENANRYNGLLRYSWQNGDDAFRLTAIGYHADWNSTDQVPARAIESGALSRFDAIDPTDGGATDRDSLSFDWTRDEGERVTRLNLYGIYYRLNLFSNFTYFLDNPVQGDQFEQIDKRAVFGGSLSRTWKMELGGKAVENTLGADFRDDLIPEVGISHTQERRVLEVVRKDRVNEASLGIFARNRVQWTPWFKSQLGLRGDLYSFDVASNLAANSGRTWDGIVSPKLSLVFGPWEKTEFYLDLGTGFHSNDARGTVIAIDPATGKRVGKAPGLVRTKGAEAGARTSLVPGLVSTFSLWYLESDSELVFVGDAGGTEAAGATRRYGLEWANFYKPTPWLTFDADLALTHARFVESAEGRYIPNSITAVFSAGATVEAPYGLFGALRMRTFGPQPLIEDNSARAPSSTIFNARIGYRYRNCELALDVLNLFDRRVNDIAYFYTSRLPGEAAGGVDDYHLHPAEPRTFRLSATIRF